MPQALTVIDRCPCGHVRPAVDTPDQATVDNCPYCQTPRDDRERVIAWVCMNCGRITSEEEATCPCSGEGLLVLLCTGAYKAIKISDGHMSEVPRYLGTPVPVLGLWEIYCRAVGFMVGRYGQAGINELHCEPIQYPQFSD